ncbi:glycosyltransferase [Kaistella sp. DKR-2]|uniref:glycosyltransferase family 2 protein n=1 Tax=Kaistella soli TaxID=2849654 RepID=UPI001C274EEA|nr:glycosyltransferase family 2 protein [Kaistella soli]MBU8883071.1 glycosyltransferase [Kaistella soli]
MKVSIIIPVYNASKYLAECLESVLVQTFTDIEMICINDGSTDDSLEILKEFQNRDSRIVIIDQKNKGVSAARNAGLEVAKGEYICFLDSDDFLVKDALSRIEYSSNYDLIINDFSYYTDGNLVRINNRQGNWKAKELLPKYLLWDVKLRLGSYLVKKTIVERNDISFRSGTAYGEDWEFNTLILYFSDKVFITEIEIMAYRVHRQSAVHKVSLNRFDTYYSRKRTYDFFKERNEKALMKIYEGYLLPQGIIDTIESIYQQKFMPFKMMSYLQKNDLLAYLKTENQNIYTLPYLIIKVKRFQESNFVFATVTYYLFQLNQLKSSLYKYIKS